MDYILEPLRQYATPVDDLHLDPSNAREHDERNLEAVRRSLNEFGQRQVIVVRKSTNVVIAGNGRLEAARRLGWTHIAAVFVDESEVQAARYAIADNRTSELSYWNSDNLKSILDAIKLETGEIESLGFTVDEVDALLGTSAEDRKYLESIADNDPDDELEDLGVDDVLEGRVEVICAAKDRNSIAEELRAYFEGREGVEVS